MSIMLKHNQILKLLNDNNYEKINELTNENLNKYNFMYIYLDKSISKNHIECFNKILNVIDTLNINMNDWQRGYSRCYISAFRYYKKTKDDNYLKELLNRNIYITNYDIHYLTEYNLDIYNIYVNNHIHDEKFMFILLRELIEHKKIMFFIETFNKLNNQNKIKFVKEYIYSLSYGKCKNLNDVFIHFMKIPEYDYNTIMIPNKMILDILNYNHKPDILNICVDYLTNKPNDLSQLDLVRINITNTKNIKYWSKKINTVKKLVINSPKMPILKSIKHGSSYNNDEPKFLIYLYHKLGFDIDIFHMFEINDVNEDRNHFMSEAVKIRNIKSLISCVQIGRYIGQEIPEHLRDDIYKKCEGHEGLDHIITDQEMKTIIKNTNK